ncbi:MAG: small basic protein [Candidatus Scalinduaceae bacterium]
MSIDKSLVTKGKLARHRNVLTRAERVKFLMDEGLWEEGKSVFGIPKVKNIKIRKKAKAAKEKTEEATTPTGEEEKEKEKKEKAS